MLFAGGAYPAARTLKGNIVMLPVQASSTVIRHLPLETASAQAVPGAEVHVGSTSELNTKLLKELLTHLETSGGAEKMDELRASLKQFGLDTSDDDFENSKLRAALEQLKNANDTARPQDDVSQTIAAQQQRVKESARALSEIQREVATGRTKANYAASQFTAAKENALRSSAPDESSSDDEISVHTSYAQLWARMAEAIKNIKTEYVDFYADLMQKYTEMYESFNNNVQKAGSEAVTAGKDGNNVNFDAAAMQNGYKKFQDEVDAIDLGSVKNWDQMSDAEKQTMKTTLQPAFNVDSSGKISFNLDQYNAAPNYPAGFIDFNGMVIPSKTEISTAGYQAWLASFNASGTALQSNMQSFAQRYSQANSTFDNLNKVLSGAISSLADSAKDVLKALG
jgi:invasin D